MNAKVNNQRKFEELRERFDQFHYEGFRYGIKEEGFEAEFFFSCGEHSFRPVHTILKKDFFSFEHLTAGQIELLLFNIGMIECVSYWKAFCSKRIVVHPFALTEGQKAFWKKLYFHGLGEFFYVNGIDTDMEHFVDIDCVGDRHTQALGFDLEDKYVVPVGGGKDSVVTLELLQGAGRDIRPFVINSRGATKDCCLSGGFDRGETIETKRTIDAHLLELNKEGYLNGHTPFSAMLAFTSLLVSAFTQRRYIALSNENSANESTVRDSKINHQYSKSLEFENDFRQYVGEYISRDFYYFSFLRPLTELHIARLFSMLHYQRVFKSCNAGSKQDIWCGKCPKCLFAFIILSPFVDRELLEEVFGGNLFEDEELLRYMDELCGLSEVKPFECVGTVSEVNAALAMRVRRYAPEEGEVLLKRWMDTDTGRLYAARTDFSDFFTLSEEHNLRAEDLDIFSNPYLYIKKSRLIRELKGERIAILGYGREGRSTYGLLKRLLPKARFVIADGDRKAWSEEDRAEFCDLDSERLKDCTLFIKTPGIPCKSIPTVPKERITSQTDIFLRLFHSRCTGISGTKGKSTTSTLLYRIVAEQHEHTLLAGNIGIPLFDVMDLMHEDSIVVMELSAHQLQFIRRAPHISVLLNLYQEHLDHFDGFEQYCMAKYNLGIRQTEGDCFIYNRGDGQTLKLLESHPLRSKTVSFGEEDYCFAEPKHLKGAHNRLNILAAMNVARLLGLDMKRAERVMTDFETLEHRLEFVADMDGVSYYNDSISTIPQATIEALRALKKVDTLILGGKDRGIDYDVLVGELPCHPLRNIAFVGCAGRRMKEILDRAGLRYNTLVSDDYGQIVNWCAEHTRKGMICLLSPAASSYDMFRNFEHRGRVFMDLVRGLGKKVHDDSDKG